MFLPYPNNEQMSKLARCLQAILSVFKSDQNVNFIKVDMMNRIHSKYFYYYFIVILIKTKIYLVQ